AILRPYGRTQPNINPDSNLPSGSAYTLFACFFRCLVAARRVAQHSLHRTCESAWIAVGLPGICPRESTGAGDPGRSPMVSGPNGLGSSACQERQSYSDLLSCRRSAARTLQPALVGPV